MIRYVLNVLILTTVCASTSIAVADAPIRVALKDTAHTVVQNPTDTFVKTNVLRVLLGEDVAIPGRTSEAP